MNYHMLLHAGFGQPSKQLANITPESWPDFLKI